MPTPPDDLTARLGAAFGRAIPSCAGHLPADARRGHLEGWDSIGHLSLVVELEREFAVTLSPADVLAMDSVAAITQRVAALLARR